MPNKQISDRQQPPTVSIVTGTYNSRPYLDQLVRCYQAQSCQDWEAIFVDDGSSDDTVAYLQSLSKLDQRLKVLQKTAEGYPSRSRNVGVAAARGEWIAFCDHDDFWAPDKLSIQLAALKAHPEVSICHTDRVVWRSAQSPDALPRYDIDPKRWELQNPRDVLLRGQRIIFSSFMTARSQLLAVGGLHPDLRGVDDFYLFLQLSQRGKILHVRQNLTFYFEHDQNLSHTPNIFIDGLFQVYELAKQQNLPDKLVRAVHAQALKSKGVSLLAEQPGQALSYFLRSLAQYRIPQTFGLIGLSWLLRLIPRSLAHNITKRLRAWKARFPSLVDLVRRSRPDDR